MNAVEEKEGEEARRAVAKVLFAKCLNKKDRAGESVIMYAIRGTGASSVVEFLIPLGVDLRARNNNKETPKMIAIKLKKVEVLGQLVEELGGLPAPKIHCSMLGVDALHRAIEEYKKNNQ